MISEPFKSKMEINNEDRVDLICCLEELLTLSSISMMRGAKKSAPESYQTAFFALIPINPDQPTFCKTFKW